MTVATVMLAAVKATVAVTLAITTLDASRLDQRTNTRVMLTLRVRRHHMTRPFPLMSSSSDRTSSLRRVSLQVGRIMQANSMLVRVGGLHTERRHWARHVRIISFDTPQRTHPRTILTVIRDMA
jgi:hypothetical protein